jgi:hypothetical protein
MADTVLYPANGDHRSDGPESAVADAENAKRMHFSAFSAISTMNITELYRRKV